MIILKLKPRDTGKFVTMVEIIDERNMPCALVHIDTFWPGTELQDDIYDMLNNKETVIVRLEIVEETE